MWHMCQKPESTKLAFPVAVRASTRLTLRPLWKHLVGFAVFGHSTAHSWHLHSMLIEFRIASRYTSFGMCFTFPLSRNPNLSFKFEGWCDGQAGSRCVNHHIAPKKTTSGLKIYLGWNYPTINKQRKHETSDNQNRNSMHWEHGYCYYTIIFFS